MTKKDYILIANAFRACNGRLYDSVDHYASTLIADLAGRLKTDNSRFDWGKFEKACNEGTTEKQV